MGSNFKNNYLMFLAMFEALAENDVYTSEKIVKKLAKLVDKDVETFVEEFVHDFSVRDFSLNRFEILNLSSTQKKKLNGNLLMRYEYRRNKNLRSIFTLVNDRNKTILILDVFTENAGKTKGKDSYDKAIDNAIKNYIEMMEDYNED